jgi:hypothetical protein
VSVLAEDIIDNIPKLEIPESVKNIQSFLRFANLYPCFIEGFSNIYYP